MNEFSDSVMVALLPATTDWSKINLPHMTLVYAGKVSELPKSSLNDLGKLAVQIARDFPIQVLSVIGIETFGEDDKVDVLRLEKTPDISTMRKRLEHWNASQHPGFKPHATIGPKGISPLYKPSYLEFNKIAVCWGDKKLVYNLKPITNK